MSADEWKHIIRSVKQDEQDESGPWTCPECDEYAVESGYRFEQGEVVELTLMCLACEAQVVVPA